MPFLTFETKGYKSAVIQDVPISSMSLGETRLCFLWDWSTGFLLDGESGGPQPNWRHVVFTAFYHSSISKSLVIFLNFPALVQLKNIPPSSINSQSAQDHCKMGSNPVEDLIETSSGAHVFGWHRDGMETEVEQASTSMTGKLQTQPFVIGVAGGAASGKTTVCDMIIEQLHDQRVVLVNQDSFYHSLSSEELSKVHEYNFDHPDAFDTEKLLSAMEMLKQWKAVDIPKYDFKSYNNSVSRRVNPSDLIILEGILIFHDPRVRDMMNMKIFVDTDADVRLARRIRRDTGEKGRDIGTVLEVCEACF
ncbi:hypothetical protein L1887_42407 [Cichorium endivia]|nr:hypothetical protein L1887_42407 [Cichorium endivia]